MMANKDTDAKRNACPTRSTCLFAFAYVCIILLCGMSFYLLLRVNGLQQTNEELSIALEKNGHNGGEDNHREILRKRRSSYPQTGRNQLDSGLSSVHLVGHQEDRLFRGQWLTWCFSNYRTSRPTIPDNSTKCTSELSHSDLLVSNDRHTIRISKAGYYFLYAQLVTTSRSNAIKSFQVAVVPGGLMTDAQPLMSSYQTQYPLRYTADQLTLESKDSAYVGGVVFLCHGDLVGVRANPNNDEDITLDSSTSEGSAFFGALAVNEVPSHVTYQYCARNIRSQ